MERRHPVALVLALGILLLMIGARAAAQVEIPRITIHELKALIDRGESVLILDTQPKAIFEKVQTAMRKTASFRYFGVLRRFRYPSRCSRASA